MNKQTASTVTGIAVAMAAGTAAYMLSSNSKASGAMSKKLKKGAGKAMKTLGSVLDSVDMIMR